jgi:phenylalanyl-tRNA synthetase alpha chain
MSLALGKSEREILVTLEGLGGKASTEQISHKSGLLRSEVDSISVTLQSKNLVDLSSETRTHLTVTEEGSRFVRLEFPERRLLTLLQSVGTANLDKIREMATEEKPLTHLMPATKMFSTEEELIIGLKWLRENRWATLVNKMISITDEGKNAIRKKTDYENLIEEILRSAKKIYIEDMSPDSAQVCRQLVKRRLISTRSESRRTLRISPVGLSVAKGEVQTVEEVTRLTAEQILSGSWKDIPLKKYDVSAAPPVIRPGKKHPFLRFLDEVRRILIGMGFVEATGPFVEAGFWNFDALFQAQDHPSREIHGSFILASPQTANLLVDEYAERVKEAHENGGTTGSTGWKYRYSFDVARRLVLRTQNTAVSARTLAKKNQPPVKMFCLDKVFRPDTPGPTRDMEFHQCEGIVLAEGLTFKHLVGYLRQFAFELGFEEVKIRPGYFPFTEPSAECFVRHPTLGWLEVLGSGLFRPEVLMPLGVDYPRVQCLAWGIGIGRYAMVKLGINDFRELHSKNLDWVRG